MATATLNIQLNDNSQYLSVLGSVEEYKDSITNIEKVKKGIMIKITAKDSKTLLSSIGSTIRKLKIINTVSEAIPDVVKKQL